MEIGTPNGLRSRAFAGSSPAWGTTSASRSLNGSCGLFNERHTMQKKSSSKKTPSRTSQPIDQFSSHEMVEEYVDFPESIPSSPYELTAKQRSCEHEYKLESSGWRRTETYKCVHCGHLKTYTRDYD